MLAFNPDDRWSAKQLLEHPYLASLHDPNDEPESDRPFHFEFEQWEPSHEVFRGMCHTPGAHTLYLARLIARFVIAELLYQEILAFHPEPRTMPPIDLAARMLEHHSLASESMQQEPEGECLLFQQQLFGVPGAQMLTSSTSPTTTTTTTSSSFFQDQPYPGYHHQQQLQQQQQQLLLLQQQQAMAVGEGVPTLGLLSPHTSEASAGFSFLPSSDPPADQMSVQTPSASPFVFQL